jgi:RNA polymerase sigma factor (sigma-70 family)
MGKTNWAALRGLLADRYDEFRKRLARRLGSEELASESLNETWLQLHRQDEAGPIQSPTGYVLRMAVNIATDHRRAETKRARRADVTAALEIPDPKPGPQREVESRFQLMALQQSLNALPERTRDILIAARLDGQSQQDIANRFGISTRMVRLELRRALDECEAFLEKNTTDRFLSGEPQTSIGEARDLPQMSPKPKRDGEW